MIDFATLATQCAPNVHPSVLAAIVKHESNFNPYAIGINRGKALKRQPRNKREAIRVANRLKRRGVNFDSGMGQINVKNMKWLNLRTSDLFDPCKNLRASSQVLTDCYSRASVRYGRGDRALKAALSCYNTGTFHRGFKNGYVQKVMALKKKSKLKKTPLRRSRKWTRLEELRNENRDVLEFKKVRFVFKRT